MSLVRVARGKVPVSCDAEVHSLTREKLVSAIEKDGFCPDRLVILKNQLFQDAYDSLWMRSFSVRIHQSKPLGIQAGRYNALEKQQRREVILPFCCD